MLDAEIGCFLDACAGVVEEQDQRAVAQCEPAAVRQAHEADAWISSRSRKRVSGGGTRLVGIAATCWQTISISGEREAMYSNRVWIAASRWLRVRM